MQYLTTSVSDVYLILTGIGVIDCIDVIDFDRCNRLRVKIQYLTTSVSDVYLILTGIVIDFIDVIDFDRCNRFSLLLVLDTIEIMSAFILFLSDASPLDRLWDLPVSVIKLPNSFRASALSDHDATAT
jgi:hypothetical protein